VPGPGSYGLKNKGATGGWSIGKGKRPAINGRDDGNDVGPGQYNHNNKARGGFKFGKDERKTVEVNKTPGYYNIPCTVPDVPKYLLKY
jgi:hypothetical protein